MPRGIFPRPSLRELFLSRIDKRGPMGHHWSTGRKIGRCWSWSGALMKSGYTQIGNAGRREYGHRASYMLFVGPIPKRRQIDHLCRNRGCVNPKHLEAVTQRTNIRRGLAGENLIIMARAKTHCSQGHPYNRENTYRRPMGGRACRECMRTRTRAWRARAA